VPWRHRESHDYRSKVDHISKQRHSKVYTSDVQIFGGNKVTNRQDAEVCLRGHEDELKAIFEQLVQARFSCRAYLRDPVPRDIIDSVLYAAQLTASWCNSQPWEVILTDGAGTERFRQALYAHAMSNPTLSPDYPFPERYVGIYKERQRECAWQLYQAIGITYGDRTKSAKQSLENYLLFGAPHVAIITAERDLGVYGVLDCGGYVQNFLLAARSHGIASIAQAALASHSKFVRAHFGIPENRLIVCGISFGYADNTHPANSFRTRRTDHNSAARWVDT
jgi:nitroreductase